MFQPVIRPSSGKNNTNFVLVSPDDSLIMGSNK